MYLLAKYRTLKLTKTFEKLNKFFDEICTLKFLNFHFEVAQNRGILIFWGGLVCKVQFHLQNLAIMRLELLSNTVGR